MTAFVAKLLTLFGVVLYAGGPIDAVTLIANGNDVPETQDMLVDQVIPAPPGVQSAMVNSGLIPDIEVEQSAPSFTEVGLRSGIGFEH